ncbi:hypothetical protein OBV_03170 [Oscillibacter valericigenes Sjm18-20]|nr:hypothetical protein OBV_03170 [Oscillibacter valericigenes Sjm18-20]
MLPILRPELALWLPRRIRQKFRRVIIKLEAFHHGTDQRMGNTLLGIQFLKLSSKARVRRQTAFDGKDYFY